MFFLPTSRLIRAFNNTNMEKHTLPTCCLMAEQLNHLSSSVIWDGELKNSFGLRGGIGTENFSVGFLRMSLPFYFHLLTAAIREKKGILYSFEISTASDQEIIFEI